MKLMNLLILAILSTLLQGLLSSAWCGSWDTTETALGLRSAIIYRPTHPQSGRLWVFLHGCNETVWEFAGGTRIAENAERSGATVLLPVQSKDFNPEGCWNWFFLPNQYRMGEETLWLASLIAQVVSSEHLNAAHVSIAGFSSGAAMTSILASCYPELFSSTAIVSGLAYQAATTVDEANRALLQGSFLTPAILGYRAWACSGFQSKQLPVIVIRGSADTRVNPINSEQIIAQFNAMYDFTDNGMLDGSFQPEAWQLKRDQVPGGYAYTVRDEIIHSRPLVRDVLVEGMAHLWSGGDPAFPLTDPKGPDATGMITEFFNSHESK